MAEDKNKTGSGTSTGGFGSGASGFGAGTLGMQAVPEQVRAAAETTLSKAKEAVDKYLQETGRMLGAMDSSAQAAQEGARDMTRKAVGYAEANVNAAFEFAHKLVKAQTLQEIASLQQQFVAKHVEQLNGQMRELGTAAVNTTNAARPKM